MKLMQVLAMMQVARKAGVKTFATATAINLEFEDDKTADKMAVHLTKAGVVVRRDGRYIQIQEQ